MAEWSKAPPWKGGVGETLPWVRIPLSPPKLKIGIGSRNGVAPQARHKRIPAKNSRIQKVFPRSAWLKKYGSILNLKVRTDFFEQTKFFFICSLVCQFWKRFGVLAKWKQTMYQRGAKVALLQRRIARCCAKPTIGQKEIGE